jgi:hypothetical protein
MKVSLFCLGFFVVCTSNALAFKSDGFDLTTDEGCEAFLYETQTHFWKLRVAEYHISQNRRWLAETPEGMSIEYIREELAKEKEKARLAATLLTAYNSVYTTHCKN